MGSSPPDSIQTMTPFVRFALLCTLAALVNRRLLRIEERLDMRRVELTHDVLCGVVKSSRDLRRERESREATERLLAEQHERELATRRSLVRARQIATGCIVLAAAAVIAIYFATRPSRAITLTGIVTTDEVIC